GTAERAHGQTFQDVNDNNGACDTSSPACDIAGTAGAGEVGGQPEVQSDGLSSAQRQAIEQRLRDERCKADKSANCVQPGGGAADTASFAGLNLFVSGDYQNKEKDQAAEAGFTSDRAGITFGLDSPMDWGVIGGAFSYNHTWGQFDDNGGDFGLDSWSGLLYGSYYPSDASFIDGVIGLGLKKSLTDRRVINNGNILAGDAKGDTAGFEFQTSVSGGYDFTFDNFTVGPRLGIHYLRTEYNAFTETGTPMALNYPDQVEDSLTSTLGFQGSVAISTSFGVVVPQVNAEYVHEFLNDRRTVHATELDGDAATFVTDPPDRDYFNVGAGLVFVLPDGVSPFLSYSAEVANRFEEVHTVTAGVRIEM
ncbi:MAG TPA: autotransporter outer membrane beta-barrel domain-containing protein, partial [Candidatus Angelobacter sp.]|nr:autotransporter outer membrane beta-barrel domain-containing protein [Candidatus Angelobacter sp.]